MSDPRFQLIDDLDHSIATAQRTRDLLQAQLDAEADEAAEVEAHRIRTWMRRINKSAGSLVAAYFGLKALRHIATAKLVGGLATTALVIAGIGGGIIIGDNIDQPRARRRPPAAAPPAPGRTTTTTPSASPTRTATETPSPTPSPPAATSPAPDAAPTDGTDEAKAAPPGTGGMVPGTTPPPPTSEPPPTTPPPEHTRPRHRCVLSLPLLGCVIRR